MKLRLFFFLAAFGLVMGLPDAAWAEAIAELARSNGGSSSGEEALAGSDIGGVVVIIIMAILYLIFKDMKKKAKHRLIKMTLNAFALILGPVAPYLSGLYTVIRFLIMAFSAVRGSGRTS